MKYYPVKLLLITLGLTLLTACSPDDSPDEFEKSGIASKVVVTKKVGGQVSDVITVQANTNLNHLFDLGTQRGGVQVDISCHPAEHDWCTNDFQTTCDAHGGGLSSQEDGSVNCNIPDA
ncbi:hypothetical protein [Methylophaga sp. OBS4]|uniref:hypothetical protein n=1 Tax=Methylophaga sp. OBS4 TaxID=2991935 RepID=UPI002250A2E4|nr:hypothetical protein [Methylophaga sp. OBS4]MCX4186639.1 hypothetical protein [Methylophaga sp. OBS4]